MGLISSHAKRMPQNSEAGDMSSKHSSMTHSQRKNARTLFMPTFGIATKMSIQDNLQFGAPIAPRGLQTLDHFFPDREQLRSK